MGKPFPVEIKDDDVLLMRHPAIPEGEKYGAQIPGGHHVEDQSVNSRHLGGDEEMHSGVLINIEDGSRYESYQVAAFSASEIRNLNIPNANTAIYKDGVLLSLDEYTFNPIHSPDRCMYPHCEIILYRNGSRVPTCNSKAMKAAIRREFAKMAERNRSLVTPQAFLN